MRHFLLILGLWVLSASAWSKVIVPIKLKNGKSLHVAIHEYVNNYGQKSLRFETDNAARVVLGHGRDIDRDGLIETFFIFGDDGIARYFRNVPSESSLDRAKYAISQHAKYSGGDYLVGIGTHILSFVFIGVDVLNDAVNTWYQDWMDQEELYLLIEANKSELTREELIYAYNLQLELGHKALAAFENAFKVHYPAWFVVDAALWLSGGAMLKWAGKGTSRLGKRILQHLQKLGMKTATGLGLKMALNAVRGSVQTASRAIAMKGLLKKSGGVLVKGLRNIKAEWKYIAFSAGIQVGVESLVNIEEVYDPDPKIMAQNMMEHPEIQENISVSVVDNLAMTAAHGAAQSTVGKFALMGIIGASSSLGVGMGLNGEQDTERVAFDGAWSIGIDSAQMILDLKVLHRFQQLSIKNKNPKLKLVGYAVVFVSQVAGYYGYSRAASYFDASRDRHEEGDYKLIPITVAVR